MILNEKQFNEVVGIDEDMTVKMVVDESNTKKLLMILSQSLYSDPIGSLVREYCTNALDSHVESGIKEPIKVSLEREQGHFVFSVEDYGVGLSPDRIEHVFSKYLSSTKEGKKDEIGYWGLGSKSGLSYCDSFTIISRYEGTEFHYLMFKSEEGTSLTMLDMFDTSMRNGVQIKISLKVDADYDLFVEKIRSQLCYFEDVFINDYYREIKNDYKIIKTDLWKYSELNEDNYLHCSLNNIYYKLDFSKLGIEPIKMPIALSFSLSDNITPTPSREAFIYTPLVKEMILNRIKEVGDYFCNLWNLSVPQASTYEEALQLHKNLYEVSIYSEKTLDSEKNITIKIPKNITKYCSSKLKSVSLSLFPNLDIEQLEKVNTFLFQEYKVISEFKDGKFTSSLANYSVSNYSYNLLLKTGEQLSNLQIQYLRWKGKRIRIVRQHTTTKLGKIKLTNGSYDCYYGLLNLSKEPNELVFNKDTQKWESSWRQIISDYKKLKESYVNTWATLDQIVPTQEFLDWKKENRENKIKIKLGVEEIKVYIGREPRTMNAKKEIIYEANTFKIKNLDKDSRMFLYTDDSREDEINKYNNFLNYKLVICNSKTFGIIKKLNLNNWLNLDDIFTKKNKQICKKICNHLKKNILNDSEFNLDNDTIRLIKYVQPKLTSKLENIQKYKEEVIIPFIFYNKFLKTYIKNKWFDYSIYHSLEELYNRIPSLEFTNSLIGLFSTNRYYSKFIKLVWDDYKDKKQKVTFQDWLTKIVNDLN